MSNVPADDFNAVPYPGHPFAATHPGRLETLGRLHGLDTAPAGRCRVLELGCGDGGNLIPLAYLYPESRFVGVDLAEAPIARGRELIAAAGLTNVELRALDLCALPDDLRDLDYLIAHGVYCWVPPAVADALLRAAGERLAPRGVAFVSYNTYPGHHQREMARQMMLYHTRAIADPGRKVWQATSLLKFLGESRVDEPTPYHLALREEFERMARNVKAGASNVIYHDELAEFNAPLYFHEFARRAAGHGLRFLCESQFSQPSPKKLSPKALETLRGLAERPLEREQYLDFLEMRYFRQTLLCRAEAPLHPAINPADFAGFHVAGAFREDDARAPLTAGVPSTFRGRDDDDVIVFEVPLLKAALRHLAEAWPAALTVNDLLTAAHARLDREGVALEADQRAAAEAEFLATLLLAFHGGVLELSPRPPARRAARVTQRPLASVVARAQMAAGWPLANLCHEHVKLEQPTDAVLFPLLDGTRDREALLDALIAALEVDDGGSSAGENSPPPVAPRDPVQTRETLRVGLEQRLEELRRLSLLVAPPDGA